jgi:hypothetical protein
LHDWTNENPGGELEEIAPPLVTQADIATFSDILTYADDDRLIAFHNDGMESLSLL